jgi:hypothetical protein
MAVTTFASLVTSLTGMSVTGITTILTGPPNALNTADLPTSWVDLPTGEEKPWTASGGGGWPTLRMDYIVAVNPVAQEMDAKQNFSDTITVLDNLMSALRSLDATKSKLSWTVRRQMIDVAGIIYWGLVVTVEGQG